MYICMPVSCVSENVVLVSTMKYIYIHVQSYIYISTIFNEILFFFFYFFFFSKTSSTALDNAIMNANPFNSDRLIRMYSNVDVYVREGARYLIFLILLISAYTYRRNVSVFQQKNMIVFKFLYHQSNYILI